MKAAAAPTKNMAANPKAAMSRWLIALYAITIEAKLNTTPNVME